MSNLDIISGISFISKLSCVPANYKIKIEKLYQMYNDNSEDKSKYANECFQFFRNEAWRLGFNNETDVANIANAFMMFCVTLI